jgi:hypothetical protein
LLLLYEAEFAGFVIEWRGPAPFYFVRLPEEHVGEVSYAARLASYGWGCVPVEARISGLDFTTSLFPRDGGYLLPLKAMVRARTGLAVADVATVGLRIVGGKG